MEIINKIKWWNELSEIWQEILLLNYLIEKKRAEGNKGRSIFHSNLKEDYKKFYSDDFNFSNYIITENIILEVLKLEVICCNYYAIDKLSPLHVFNLKRLAFSCTNVNSLKEIEVFINLEEISFNNCKIDDIESIGKLVLLKKIFANSNFITDLRPLKNILKLEMLWLDDNIIYDLKPLKYLKFLNTLLLANNKISDLNPLSKCVRLKSLDVNGNRISSIDFANNLNNLSRLNLTNNFIEDISPLYNSKKLTALYLNNNRIKNLNPLSSKNELKYLYCFSNRIESLSPLFNNLVNLKILNVSDNPVGINEIENLYQHKLKEHIINQKNLNNSTKTEFYFHVLEFYTFSIPFDFFKRIWFGNYFNYKIKTIDNFGFNICSVLFEILRSHAFFNCNSKTNFKTAILTAIAIRQIVYEFTCEDYDDKDYNTLESIDSLIDEIIENRYFFQNDNLREYYEANYEKILQKVKHTIIDHYERQVLNKDEDFMWWNKFLEDIDYKLDYSTDERGDRSSAMDDYLSYGFNY
jgi:Leucine-rich repeat (LRR) protein